MFGDAGGVAGLGKWGQITNPLRTVSNTLRTLYEHAENKLDIFYICLRYRFNLPQQTQTYKDKHLNIYKYIYIYTIKNV